MNKQENRKILFNNTIYLYIRTFLLLIIGLYTSRVILKALGVEDFGTYNLVGGVVSIFSSVTGCLSVAVQRYLNFALGENDLQKTKNVFSTSILIFVSFSVIILVISESLGLWFINNILNIPEERLDAANWIYQFSIFTFIFNLISVPYNALIIAHEKIKIFAYISLIEGVLKLAIALLISYSPCDKLISYGFLLLLSSIIIRLVYTMYSKTRFPESKVYFCWDKSLISQMTGFAGWNLMGASSALVVGQGFNFIINIFFGVILNASRAIAFQVEAQVKNFATNFTTALNPQIMKAYASKDFDNLYSLIINGAKISFYLLMILSIPIIIEVNQILRIWLRNVPEYASIFVQLSLVAAMINAISNPLIIAMQASGKLKTYQITISTLDIINLPIVYIIYKLNILQPEILYIVYILVSFTQLIVRIYLLGTIIKLPIIRFLIDVILKGTCCFIISFVLLLEIRELFNENLFRLFFICILSVITNIFLIIIIGINRNQRKIIFGNIIKKWKH